MDILEFHDDDADMGSDTCVESDTDLIISDEEPQWLDFDFAEQEDMDLGTSQPPAEISETCHDLQKREESDELQEDEVTDHAPDDDEP